MPCMSGRSLGCARYQVGRCFSRLMSVSCMPNHSMTDWPKVRPDNGSLRFGVCHFCRALGGIFKFLLAKVNRAAQYWCRRQSSHPSHSIHLRHGRINVRYRLGTRAVVIITPTPRQIDQTCQAKAQVTVQRLQSTVTGSAHKSCQAGSPRSGSEWRGLWDTKPGPS